MPSIKVSHSLMETGTLADLSFRKKPVNIDTNRYSLGATVTLAYAYVGYGGNSSRRPLQRGVDHETQDYDSRWHAIRCGPDPSDQFRRRPACRCHGRHWRSTGPVRPASPRRVLCAALLLPAGDCVLSAPGSTSGRSDWFGTLLRASAFFPWAWISRSCRSPPLVMRSPVLPR